MSAARPLLPVLMLSPLLFLGCGGDSSGQSRGPGGPGGGRGHGGMPESGGPGATSAVPVEVASVERRGISSFIETNGVLEAENEVDLVARISAPVIELLAEEGMTVKRGQLLARLEQEELRLQVEISRVALDEATLVYQRAKRLRAEELISVEEYQAARADFESAEAQLAASRIQLGYTNIKAPFSGWVVLRYVSAERRWWPSRRRAEPPARGTAASCHSAPAPTGVARRRAPAGSCATRS